MLGPYASPGDGPAFVASRARGQAGGAPTDPAPRVDDREHTTTAAPAQLVVLAAASSRIVGERDDAAVERVVVEQAAQLLAADDVRLVRLDPDLQTLRLRQAIGPAARRRGTPQPRGEGVLGQVLQTGQPFHAPDFATHPLATTETQESSLASVVAVPLRCQ